jgi:hypothetical protein
MIKIRSRNQNLTKVGTGTLKNSYGYATLPPSYHKAFCILHSVVSVLVFTLKLREFLALYINK